LRALCTVDSGEAERGGVEVALNARVVGDEEGENKARRNPWIGNKMRPKRPVRIFGYSKITTIFFSVLDLTLTLITKMPNIQSSGNISVETSLSCLLFFLFDVRAFLAHETSHKIERKRKDDG